MKPLTLAKGLAAIAALSLAAPAIAGNVPINYTLTVSEGGQTARIGTLTLDFDGSAYSLDSLGLTIKDKSAIVTSDVTLSPVAGTSDYCLYTFSSCSILPEKNSLYVIFDPALTSQTSTLYVYSTTDEATETLPLTIAAVPEPATWMMMMVGFGSIGFTLRFGRKSRQTALAAQSFA